MVKLDKLLRRRETILEVAKVKLDRTEPNCTFNVNPVKSNGPMVQINREETSTIPEDIEIRPLDPAKDREKVRYICCETAFMGRPLEHYMTPRSLFADLITDYYIEYEPESCLVAEDVGKSKLIGYLLGTVDTARERRISKRCIYPKIVVKTLTFRYRLSLKTLIHAVRSLRAFIVDERLDPPIHDYPAHLHINLLAKYRGQGIGTQLMDHFLRYLIGRKVSGVHLVTTSNNSQAISFYKKYGFKLYKRIKTSAWQGVVNESIENLIFTLDLPLEE